MSRKAHTQLMKFTNTHLFLAIFALTLPVNVFAAAIDNPTPDNIDIYVSDIPDAARQVAIDLPASHSTSTVLKPSNDVASSLNPQNVMDRINEIKDLNGVKTFYEDLKRSSHETQKKFFSVRALSPANISKLYCIYTRFLLGDYPYNSEFLAALKWIAPTGISFMEIAIEDSEFSVPDMDPAELRMRLENIWHVFEVNTNAYPEIVHSFDKPLIPLMPKVFALTTASHNVSLEDLEIDPMLLTQNQSQVGLFLLKMAERFNKFHLARQIIDLLPKEDLVEAKKFILETTSLSEPTQIRAFCKGYKLLSEDVRRDIPLPEGINCE